MSPRRLRPVLALAALLALASLVGTPAFWPVDETSHVAYADHLLRTGRLPEIDTPIPVEAPYPGLPQRLAWERAQRRDGRQDIWTSNHPPLPYVVQAAALGTGRLLGDGRLALVLARLTSVVWLVVGVWATVRLAFLLAPAGGPSRRSRLDPPDVAYAAGALVAVTPTLTHLSGVVFNDVPAFAMSTLCLLVGARAAFAGVDPRRLAVMGLLGGAAAITRVSCLPAVAVMALLGLYGWWRDPSALRRPGVTPAATAAVLAFTPAACFWIRNVVLYGDLTATEVLLAKFDRDLNDPVDALLVDGSFWLTLWNRMWADLTTGHWAVGMRADITEAVLGIVLVATLIAVWRGVRPVAGLRPPATSGALGAWAPAAAAALAAHPRRVVWAVASLLPLSLLVSATQFHAAGGSLHGRYLLGGHAVVATAIVVALGGVPRVGRLLAVGVLIPVFVVDLALVQGLLVHHATTWDRAGLRLILPHLAPVPGPTHALLGAAGLTTVVIVVQHVRRRSTPPAGPSRPAGRYGLPATPIRSIRESAAR